MKTSTCRSCKAPIIWVKTAHMKNHPLDAKPDDEGEWVITTATTQGGDVPMMVKATPMHDADDPHYTSHFATCPQSQSWSNKRKGSTE